MVEPRRGPFVAILGGLFGVLLIDCAGDDPVHSSNNPDAGSTDGDVRIDGGRPTQEDDAGDGEDAATNPAGEISNGTFEGLSDRCEPGWTPDVNGVPTTTDVARSGSKACSICPQNGSAVRFAISASPRKVGPGRWVGSAWFRAPASQAGGEAFVRLTYIASDGSEGLTPERATAIGQEWTQVSEMIVAPPNSVNVRVQVGGVGPGCVIVDDVALRINP